MGARVSGLLDLLESVDVALNRMESVDVALNRRGVGSLNDVVYGQVTPVDRDVLSQHFCASDEACEKLRSFERVQFRNVTPILTFARSSEQTGEAQDDMRRWRDAMSSHMIVCPQ